MMTDVTLRSCRRADNSAPWARAVHPGPAAAGTLSRIPQRHYFIVLSLSAGAIKIHILKRKSAPKHVPLIFAASVCATFHMVFFVTLDSLTSSSTRCSTSNTACSYIHCTCRVQQVRAGGIPGTELSHKILLYFKSHMVIQTLYTGILLGWEDDILGPTDRWSGS